MTFTTVRSTSGNPGRPVIRKIRPDDLIPVLREGFGDFAAMPTFAVFLVIIYPVIGLVIARITMGEDLLPLAYPLAAGFALLGPIAALGLYELSRRRERGMPIGLGHAVDVLRSPALPSIAGLGAILMVLFVAWLLTAQALYAGLFGTTHTESFSDLLHTALTTKSGLTLIILGNGIGFLFAAAVFCISVVSFLLMLDRGIGLSPAIATSVRVVQTNPLAMAAWGVIIAGAMAIGCATLFIGLALILPILGHATWPLYRRVVASGQATG